MPTSDIAQQEEAICPAQVNASFRRSLQAFANEPDLNAFLGRALGDIGGRLGALYILMWLTDGTSGAAAARLAWSNSHGCGDADQLLPPELTREILTRRGNGQHPSSARSLLDLPLASGDGGLGGITVILSQPNPPSAAEIEWAHAMACQTSLALRLDWISSVREAAAVLKERARIAREIHDGIAQLFVGIQRHLNSASLHGDALAVVKAIALAKDGLTETRRTMQALGPQKLDNMPFVDAVQDIAAELIPQTVQVNFSSMGVWPELPPERESNLFRVVQEAFNNVAKHSTATQVNVDISCQSGELTIFIQDNGCGFDLRGGNAGFGLTAMRQRMDAINGALQLASAPGAGTRVSIRLPCG